MTPEQARQACVKRALRQVSELAYENGRLSIRLERAEAKVASLHAKLEAVHDHD